MTEKKNKAVVPIKTTAENIWDAIKECQLEMFALPDQTVQKYCTPITVEPTKLYMTYKVSAVIPALENALYKKYDFENVDGYIIVANKQHPIKSK